MTKRFETIKKEKVFFKTFGCRTNQFDTQVMISKLNDFELSESEADSDIVVVNSCTVTNGADSSVRHYINTLKRKNPHAKVILAGCGAHSKGESLLRDEKVFGVMGHSEKENINRLLKRQNRFYEIGDLNHIDTTVVEEFVGKSRAFIKIQEGCDFECSYCIIPQVRGKARSHEEETIINQIRRLAANGFGEFILTGTNVGSYGKDKSTSIARLLRKISQIRGVRRVRIGSLEPIQIDEAFMELLDEPWMAKHLHIALQHTSDVMLERMRRRNRYHKDLELFEKLASKGYALGTDFIVGHPGEGENEWNEALERLKRLPLTHIHAFTYSKRDNTRSATMRPEVNGKVAKTRLKKLTRLIKEKNYRFRQIHASKLQVLVEGGKNGIYHGYDQFYNKITIHTPYDLRGEWIEFDSVIVEEEGNIALF